MIILGEFLGDSVKSFRGGLATSREKECEGVESLQEESFNEGTFEGSVVVASLETFQGGNMVDGGNGKSDLSVEGCTSGNDVSSSRVVEGCSSKRDRQALNRFPLERNIIGRVCGEDIL